MPVKIDIVAVGKLKERFWRDAAAEYSKRLGAWATVACTEVADRDPKACGGQASALELEGNDIIKALKDAPYVVLLAIDGRELSSENLAAHIEELMVAGTSKIVFVVGGSAGVSQAVRERADEELSLGSLTLPHNLARIVLLEQLYRSFKIMRGEPYHK